MYRCPVDTKLYEAIGAPSSRNGFYTQRSTEQIDIANFAGRTPRIRRARFPPRLHDATRTRARVNRAARLGARRQERKLPPRLPRSRRSREAVGVFSVRGRATLESRSRLSLLRESRVAPLAREELVASATTLPVHFAHR